MKKRCFPILRLCLDRIREQICFTSCIIKNVKLKVIVHETEEGGYWAKVPSIPGCTTQRNSFEELLQNLYEAVVGCLVEDGL